MKYPSKKRHNPTPRNRRRQRAQNSRHNQPVKHLLNRLHLTLLHSSAKTLVDKPEFPAFHQHPRSKFCMVNCGPLHTHTIAQP